MRTKRGKRGRFELELEFRQRQRSLSRPARRVMLDSLQRRRKGQGNGRPARVFWVMTGTGDWERL